MLLGHGAYLEQQGVLGILLSVGYPVLIAFYGS